MAETAVRQRTRFCPGEERITISDAVCFGRRRANFPLCPGCQFNDDEQAAGHRQRVIAHGLVVQEHAAPTLEQVFRACDIRGAYPEHLNEDLAWRIGFAAGTFLKSALRGMDRSDIEMNRVVIGRDQRESSRRMAAALVEGVRAGGVPVIDVGLIDTPQLYFAVNHLKSCGGIQTTTSRPSAEYVDYRICGGGGRPIGADTGLHDVRAIATNTSRHDTRQRGEMQQVDLSNAYRRFVLSFLDMPKHLNVVVDASNGMAGRWLPIIFDEIDELTIEALNFESDDQSRLETDPLAPTGLQPLRERVLETGADLGVYFDGDADRCILVDEKAQAIAPDLLTALLAGYFLKKMPGATIVHDLRSSRIVSETVLRAGGTPQRSRVGPTFMKKIVAERRAVFGGERSGHYYFQDNWSGESGLLAFVHTLNICSQSDLPISKLIAPYRKYASSGERSFVNDDMDGTIQQLGRLYGTAKVDFLDGVTVTHPGWWLNVRKSNTQPLLRLNLEANTPELLNQKLAEVVQHLGDPVDP